MRTTIDLPEDLHRIVASLATHTGSSLSNTAARLMRRGLEASAAPSASRSISTDPATGLPVVRSGRAITPEDVKALEDEA
jgi:negative regulator of replication initiation